MFSYFEYLFFLIFVHFFPFSRSEFLEEKPGTTDDFIVNEETMRRQLICDWVNENTPKIQSSWVPESATTLRCLGEEQFIMSSTGLYTPSTTCSGHGVCQPDPWIQYSGICVCYRGYEHRDCSILSGGEVVNAMLYHPTELKKGLLAEYWLFGCMFVIAAMFLIANWTVYMRDTPIFHNLASSHSFILLGSACVTLCSYPFWVMLPDREVCTFKWSILAWGIAMIIGINGIKLNYVLNQVNFMPGDRPERLANVNSKALLRDTAKLSWPVLALTVLLYYSSPGREFVRIPNMIWLKQDVCTYSWLGSASLYAMLFYIFLNWFASVANMYQVFQWNKFNAYYGDWLYIKESYFIAFTIGIEGLMLGGAIFSHLWVTSYPSWCNLSTDPLISLNATCETLKEEERTIFIHTITLLAFAIVPVAINYFPKWVLIICYPIVNDMRNRYTRLKYPEEILSEQGMKARMFGVVRGGIFWYFCSINLVNLFFFKYFF